MRGRHAIGPTAPPSRRRSRRPAGTVPGTGARTTTAARREMVGPIHHTSTREAVDGYQVEPYVVAADIYGVPPHVGRGGWTWYTGSAGWMFRVALESVLGVTFEGGHTLRVAPCIPDA